ncbi:hypothetical protein QBC35DRAFT_476031 [Podospora australis]|uniref:Uncharacterized protein n=1 Tax=Podospora australis TaxID=1536484 RepID=A0AAN6WQT2_9PEZI|nr:hypothetical protein QBC35DRAFT_476031 [Podospora australis]
MCGGIILEYQCPCTLPHQSTPIRDLDLLLEPTDLHGISRGHAAVRNENSGVYQWCDDYWNTPDFSLDCYSREPRCPKGISYRRVNTPSTQLCRECLRSGCHLNRNPRSTYGHRDAQDKRHQDLARDREESRARANEALEAIAAARAQIRKDRSAQNQEDEGSVGFSVVETSDQGRGSRPEEDIENHGPKVDSAENTINFEGNDADLIKERRNMKKRQKALKKQNAKNKKRRDSVSSVKSCAHSESSTGSNGSYEGYDSDQSCESVETVVFEG